MAFTFGPMRTRVRYEGRVFIIVHDRHAADAATRAQIDAEVMRAELGAREGESLAAAAARAGEGAPERYLEHHRAQVAHVAGLIRDVLTAEDGQVEPVRFAGEDGEAVGWSELSASARAAAVSELSGLLLLPVMQASSTIGEVLEKKS